MEQALAIHRYNDQEIEDMLVQYEEYDDEALLTEIRTFLLSGSTKRCYDGTVPPSERKAYVNHYLKYRESDMPFTVLMYDSFDDSICRKYFRWREILIHILEIPMSEVPLYLNSEDSIVKFFSRWRLKIGK